MSKILSVFRKDKKVKEIELNRTFDIQNVQSFGFGLPPNLSTPIAVDPLQALFAVGTLKGTIILYFALTLDLIYMDCSTKFSK